MPEVQQLKAPFPWFGGKSRIAHENVYQQKGDVRSDVREYCLAHGHEMRIALCGYEGEHEMPGDWECLKWKAKGGYGSRSENGKGRINSQRERIWFSPVCLNVKTQLELIEDESCHE